MAVEDDDKTRVVATHAPPGGGADDATRVVSRGASGTTSQTTSITPDGAPHSDPPPAAAATIKQRFVLQEVLGSGGMGAVYRAIDLRKQEADDRDPYVAVKLLNEDFRRHPDAFISLQREARKSQTLAHPNIVNVYDFDRDGDRVFMTMECLQGQPLDQLLRAHPDGLEKGRALTILRDVAAALRYAHSHQIAHSDLKPGNVFVTDKGVAKVLDFGIARAVSDIGADPDSDAAIAATRFDPASLGALTPAYASLEMLQGAEPVLSDDLYALGCIAYELFTGRHPFERKPALQAREQGLVPRRIPGLSRRQWRALERALAFERERRIDSVDALLAAFEERRRPLLLASALALLAVGALAALLVYQQSGAQPDLGDLRAGLEQEMERRLAQSEVDRLLAGIEFAPGWLRAFAVVFEDYREVMPADDPELLARERQMISALLAAAAQRRERGELDEAQRLLQEAARWGGDTAGEARRLDAALDAEREQLAQAERERRQRESAERERLNRELEQERQRQQQRREEERVAQAEAALRAGVDCARELDTADTGRRLQALRELDEARYRALRPQLAAQLAGCAGALAGTNPAAAQQLRERALSLFPEADALAQLLIDHCAAQAPGSGGRGPRFGCADALRDGGRGPQLVVIPGPSGGAPYAIGRFEVSGDELARFCRGGGACGDNDFSGALPATGVSRDVAQAYLAWLGEQTGFDYRLPTAAQWAHAARADGALDPNRNCTVRAGGVRRGGVAVPVSSGAANAWGLVNAAGNVQELVLDGDALAAAGGHHGDPLDRCTPELLRPHDGGADALTGLRVMRALHPGGGR